MDRPSKKYMLVMLLLLAASSVRADFVDIATIRVNGKMVRKLTNNNSDPYLVNFSRFRPGDTVNIEIWTDHGAENNAFLTLRNLAAARVDTFDRKKEFLLTPEMLETEHLISVIYIYEYPREMKITWDICKIVPDDRIELVYAAVNNLKDLLISPDIWKSVSSSSVLMDSVTVDFNVVRSGTTFERQAAKAVRYPKSQLSDIVRLTPAERSYLDAFEPIDYAQLYGLDTDLHVAIQVKEATIDRFSVTFGDFSWQLRFSLLFVQGNYLLESIQYTTH
jgi:hypothetical protein